jgi:hypothetical protein
MGMLPWKRFWCPQGTDVSCGLFGDAFLTDPESDFGAHVNAHLVKLQELLDRPCLVLCGEPGIGKSKTLEAAADDIRANLPSGENLIWVEFRAIPDIGTFTRRTLDLENWRAWRKSNEKLTLVIDGVDEGVIRLPRFIAFLSDELKSVDRSRLQLILACRTAEWPTKEGEGLIGLFDDKRPSIYELCPLREADARMAAVERSVDPDAFLQAVLEKEVTALAARPITLFFLLSEFASGQSLPGTHRDLYETGCKHLCEEHDHERVEALRRLPQMYAAPQPAQLHRVACRIAALLILSGRYSVYVGPSQDRADTDLDRNDIGYTPEVVDGERFEINGRMILETLATSLFNSRGAYRYGFAHQTFMECLAGLYLADRPLTQIRQLLCQRDDAGEHLIPQLAELASWVAVNHPEFLTHVLRNEPEVLARSDIAKIDPARKKAIVTALLERVKRTEVFDENASRQFYVGLNHPGLADQLRPYIEDKSLNVVVRRLTIRLAGHCHLHSLFDVFISLLSDPAESKHIRSGIALVLSEIIPPDRVEEVIPLAKGELGDDPDDELKACALSVLIPRVWSVRAALPYLPEDYNRYHFGRYWAVLMHHIPRHVQSDDLPYLLCRLIRWRDCFDSMSWFRNIAEKALVEAVKRINEPEIAKLFVRAWLSKVRKQRTLPDEESEFWKLVKQDDAARKHLIESLLNSSHTAKHDLWVGSLAHSFLLRGDLPWLLRSISNAPRDQSKVWAIAVELYVRWFDDYVAHWDLFLDTRDAVSELAARVPRSSNLGDPQVISRRQIAKRLAGLMSKSFGQSGSEPTFETLMSEHLSMIEAGDYCVWANLYRDLFHRRGHEFASDYDVFASPGWRSANELQREQIKDAAFKFLTVCDEPAEPPILTLRTMSAYAAIWLLRTRAETDTELRQAVAEKWISALIEFPNDSVVQRQEMVALAYALNPDRCTDILLRDLRDEKAGGCMDALQSFGSCWDNRLSDWIVEVIASDDLPPFHVENVVDFLCQVDEARALTCFQSLISTVSTNERSTPLWLPQVLAVAIRRMPDKIWDIIWSMLDANPKLAETVLQRASFHLDASEERPTTQLAAGRVAHLFRLMVKIFPPADDPPHVGGPVLPRQDAALFRDQQLRILVNQGTDDSCRELLRLAGEFPDYRLLIQSLYREALKNKRRKSWTPKLPGLILQLIQRAEARVIDDEDDLLEVVLESLSRLQTELTGRQNPQVGDLWTYEGSGNTRSSFAPKDEEDISGKIAWWLEHDLGPVKGVILNREVQPRRGLRTDIQVDAVTHADDVKERLTVIIEVKGCWNASVRTAISSQLVENYLKPHNWTHGIYLVAWFICDRWDSLKKRKKSHLDSATFEEAKREVANLALPINATGSSLRVSCFVLDCRMD